MLNFFASSSEIRRQLDAYTCLLYQATPGVVRQVVGSRVAPPQHFEPVSREILELVYCEKDELARCTGLLSAGAHQ